MLKRNVLIFVLTAFLCSSVPAIAESPKIECLKEQIEMFDRHSKEMSGEERYTKTIKGKFDLLCKYGRTKGINIFRAEIAEQEGRRDTVCWSEINVGVLKGMRAAFDKYLKAVESDCRQAGAMKKGLGD